MDLSILSSFTLETCVRSGCGITFAVSSKYITHRRKDHELFYCPNGHSQFYSVENGEEKAKREKAEVEQRLQARLNEAEWLKLVAERARDQAIKDKRRLEKRIKAGVCPRCNRTFQDIAAHIHTKHKDYALPPAAMKRIEPAKG